MAPHALSDDLPDIGTRSGQRSLSDRLLRNFLWAAGTNFTNQAGGAKGDADVSA